MTCLFLRGGGGVGRAKEWSKCLCLCLCLCLCFKFRVLFNSVTITYHGNKMNFSCSFLRIKVCLKYGSPQPPPLYHMHKNRFWCCYYLLETPFTISDKSHRQLFHGRPPLTHTATILVRKKISHPFPRIKLRTATKHLNTKRAISSVIEMGGGVILSGFHLNPVTQDCSFPCLYFF